MKDFEEFEEEFEDDFGVDPDDWNDLTLDDIGRLW